MHWSILAGNLVAGVAAALDQAAGTGVVQAAGPWAVIGLTFANLLAHSVVAAMGKAP